jgi:hypothetical protein
VASIVTANLAGDTAKPNTNIYALPLSPVSRLNRLGSQLRDRAAAYMMVRILANHISLPE